MWTGWRFPYVYCIDWDVAVDLAGGVAVDVALDAAGYVTIWWYMWIGWRLNCDWYCDWKCGVVLIVSQFMIC